MLQFNLFLIKTLEWCWCAKSTQDHAVSQDCYSSATFQYQLQLKVNKEITTQELKMTYMVKAKF